MSTSAATDKKDEKDEKPGAIRIDLPWLVKGFVGLAGLAVYVELVGGAVLWARYHSAHLPEVQTIEALSPEYLLVVGITSLFVPFLAGAIAAASQYVLAPSNPRGTLPRRFGFVLLVLVLFASYMALFGVDGLSSGTRLILLGLAWIGGGAVWMVAARSRGFVTLAVIFFAYGALYGACFKLVRELTITPRFDLAVVFRGEERSPLAGLYVARSSDEVLLARLVPDRSGERDGEWQTIVVPADQVTTLAFGPRGQPVEPSAQERADDLRRALRKQHLDLKKQAPSADAGKPSSRGGTRADRAAGSGSG